MGSRCDSPLGPGHVSIGSGPPGGGQRELQSWAPLAPRGTPGMASGMETNPAPPHPLRSCSKAHQGTGTQEPCRQAAKLLLGCPAWAQSAEHSESSAHARGQSEGLGQRDAHWQGWGVLSWLPLHSQGTGPSAHLKAPQTCAGSRSGPGCLDEHGPGPDRGSVAQQEWGLARGESLLQRGGLGPGQDLAGHVPTHAANSCHGVYSTVSSFPRFPDGPGTASL